MTRRTGCQEASQTIDRMVYLKLQLLTLNQDQNIIVQMQWHSTSALIIWQGIIYMDLVMMRGGTEGRLIRTRGWSTVVIITQGHQHQQ